jgi:hypothetical protein
MKKEMIMILLSLVAIISMVVFAPALVIIGDPFLEIVTTYGPGQKIQGTTNFSLDNELSNSVVRGQIGTNIVTMKITEFLDEASVPYTCEPSHCLETYNAIGTGTPSKIISFSGNEGTAALKATEQDVSIVDLEFNITGSQGTAVCGETPLKLDLLDDGIIDWEYKETGGWCSAGTYGENYNPGQATDENNIGSVPYCEKIRIGKTGKVLIRAQVRIDGNPANAGIDDLIFSIYDEGTLLGSCTPGQVTNTVFALKGCAVYGAAFYIQEEKEFFVCVKNVGSEEYSIKSEGESPFSGIYGEPPSENFVKDYAISVIIAEFLPFNGQVTFNSSVYLGQDLQDYLQDFIVEIYDQDCTDGCGIPMRFTRTQTSQQTTISDLDFVIETTGGQTTKHNFYNLQVQYAQINMTEEVINLDILNMTVPEAHGTHNFVFYVGSQTETASFEVAQVPVIQSLSPLSAIPGEQTTFYVTASSPKGNDLVSYSWDFGDGSTQETTDASVTHIYDNTGNFNFVVSVEDSEGLVGTRTFVVYSNITKQGLNNSIVDKLEKISDFRTDVQGEWYEDIVLGQLGLTAMENNLNDLYGQLETAGSAELISIKDQLDVTHAPLRLEDTMVFSPSQYIPNPDSIRPDLVEMMGGGSYNAGSHQEYVSEIMNWFDNQGMTTSGAVKTAVFEDGTSQELVTVINVDVSMYDSEAYLIVNLPAGVYFQDVLFRQSYNAQEVDSSLGIPLTSSSTIDFVFPGRYRVTTLQMFLAPNLNTLSITGGHTPLPGEEAPWSLAIFFIILIVLGVAAALYFIWRGKKFKGFSFSLGGLFGGGSKKKLFKNPMDLVNLTSFIRNAKARGMKKEQIESKLRSAGWAKSQINFAFKKVK